MTRLFKSNKKTLVPSVLNIIGLAAAFAALYVILVQVHHDFNYNKSIKDSDRIYCMMVKDQFSDNNYSCWTNRPISEAIIASSPEVESGGCGYIGDNCPSADIVMEDGRHIEVRIGAFSNGGKDVFGFKLVSGSWDNWIDGNTYAISESAAKRIGVDVGDVAKLRREDWRGLHIDDAYIVAIYEDVPPQSDLASFDMFYNIGKDGLEDFSQWGYNYFVKLHEGTDPTDFENASLPIMKDVWARSINLEPSSLDKSDKETFDNMVEQSKPHLMKLTDAYFAANAKVPGKTGNRTTTMTLLAIAMAVLIIAFINYINFFFAMMPLRLRSINTRKVLGSSRFQLIMSTVVESVVMNVIALAFALLIVMLFCRSSLASLIDAPLQFDQNWGIVLLTIGSALLVSVAASLYPAIVATAVNPAFALKGTFGTAGKGNLFRTGLIGLQFTVSIVLIICAIFIHQQRKFMLSRDLGFDKEQLLTARTSLEIGFNRADAEIRLRANPAIKDVAWGDGPFVIDQRMGWGRKLRNEDVHWQCYPVSWNFLDFMGIDIVEGRNFLPADEQSENGVYILNQTAKKMYDIHLDDQIQGHTNSPAEIAGFCSDFNFSSLRDKVGPFALYVFGKKPWRPCMTLFVRTVPGADVPALIEQIKETLHELDPSIPADDFDVQLFDQTLQSQYQKEQNLSQLITLFTALAIIISLMGVFGLVMFETERRRKEISIRRVHGATVQQILTMFNTRFVWIVLVSFVIAVPVSIIVMHRYLEGFAYRVPLYCWVFAIALLGVLAVTVTVVTLRSLSAVKSNPAKVLKSE